MKRKSGVLLHISSLPSGYGVGNFGASAYEFVDMLKAGGFSAWQVLPFCMPDGYNSPYKSRASFSSNPYFIDIETLVKCGYLTKTEADGAKEQGEYLAEYDRLAEQRLPLLAIAAERASLDKTYTAAMENFFSERCEIENAAKFLALSERNGGTPWQTWKYKKPDPVRLFFWKFVQFEFHRQWKMLREYANSLGIEIIGDLPMYVDLDSADVWNSPEMFQLDEKGYPTSVAGVPPDAFSEEGQLWGNPLYNYDVMKKDGYSFWRARIEYALSMFDGVRIDHFRAFEAYWSIPNGAKSAKEGKWIEGAGKEIVDVIKEVAKDRLVIAEDLGVITDGVRALLEYSGMPGMRVLQFGFNENEHSPHLPHNYVEHSVAYTGTHDNNTTLGALYELSDGERKRVADYLATDPCNVKQLTKAAVCSILRSKAALVILPLQDILGYGKDTRMNTPGTSVDNWAYRVASWQISSINVGELKYLNTLFARIPD